MKDSRVVLRILEMILFITLFGSARSYAQVSCDTATLKGTILDPVGLPVPGADIAVSNSITSVTRTYKSSDIRTYQVLEVPPGTYNTC